MSNPMTEFVVGQEIFEIVDEAARKDIDTLQTDVGVVEDDIIKLQQQTSGFDEDIEKLKLASITPDTTLGVAGAAADSKVVGDAINNIESTISDIENTITEIRSDCIDKSGGVMTGDLTSTQFVVANGSDYQAVSFKNTDQENEAGSIQFENSDRNFSIVEYNADQDNNDPRYSEQYSFPNPDEGLTETKYYSVLTSKSPVSIEQGGTGARTVADARNALGLGNTDGAVPVENGGTGATTASDARANLGVASAIHEHSDYVKKAHFSLSGTILTITTTE